MITLDKIKVWAERQYWLYLQIWLRGEAFQPLELPVGKLPSAYLELREAVQQLQGGSKEVRGYGYRLEYQSQNTRQFGAQTFPARIYIDTEADLLRLLRRETEFSRFAQDVATIRRALPQLELWLLAHPKRVIDCHGLWPDLLAVCAYFVAHPLPNLYIRELPIPIHTKFIEQNEGILRQLLDSLLPPDTVEPVTHFERRYGLRYDEPLIRFRHLSALPYSDLSVPLSQFAATPIPARRCIISENKMTFLTLPLLPDTFALFGAGFRIELLSEVGWLRACELLYWGDLDAHGFQILSMLRGIFPHVHSVMMDRVTFDQFREFAVPGTPVKEMILPGLDDAEAALFHELQQNNLRLEQERISHEYALAQILKISQM